MLLQRVISGGQTGVDVAALRAAQRCSIPTGGWMPRGYRTNQGPRPAYAALYGLRALTAPDYPTRTRANVMEADLTLRVGVKWDSPGMRCTLRAIKAKGGVEGRDWDDVTPGEDHALIVAWLRAEAKRVQRPLILNVAGNSEETSPGIEVAAEALLTRVFSSPLLGDP